MDEQILINQMELFTIIFKERIKNLLNAENGNFFEILALFLEKHNKDIFTEKTLEVLLKLGKVLYSNVDNNLNEIVTI